MKPFPKLDYIQDLPSLPSKEEKSKQEILKERILKLKKEKDAIILCHNYQSPEIHEVSDFVGDSYGLSKAATQVKQKTIVFCGVRFMAETAYILNPTKTVLLPESMAGCALADGITAQDVRDWRKQYPGAAVVMYINSSADVKAETDVICTSSNALHIVNSVKEDTILFGPDENLASVVMKKTKKKVIPWHGFCPVHKAVTQEMLLETRAMFPKAIVIVHPECNPEVVEKADAVLSTSEMLDYIKKSKHKQFIVGTEIGLIQRAQIDNPDKEIHPIYKHKSCDQSCACPFMKITSLQSIVNALEKNEEKITVEETLRKKALRSVERMLELGLPK